MRMPPALPVTGFDGPFVGTVLAAVVVAADSLGESELRNCKRESPHIGDMHCLTLASGRLGERNLAEVEMVLVAVGDFAEIFVDNFGPD